MKDPQSKEERIAALLDGALGERQREELLAHLSVADEEYRIFADTASILRELEEAEHAAATIPLPCASPQQRALWKPSRWAGMALAA